MDTVSPLLIAEERVSRPKSRAGDMQRLGIWKYKRLFCLARCAGDCGARAHYCIFQVIPTRIAICFAAKCGAKGFRCARKCLTP